MIGGLPSLSEIEATTVDHLTSLAADFDAEADLIESCFTEAHELMGSVCWEGQAYDAAYARTDSDRTIAVGKAAQRRDAAKVARFGAENMLLAKAAALRAVDEAREAGFEVREDLAVSAYTDDRPLEEAMRLQPKANEIAAEIRAEAASMVTIDQNTTAKLAAATAGFGSLRFTEAPLYTTDGGAPGKRHNGVQLVDNKTLKDSPAPTPDPHDPSTGGVPDPVGKLGLPNYNPGSLSEAETRTVYTQGELRMRELNDQLARQGVSAEERAKIMFAQRNALRSWARELMSNRALADRLNATEPNLTFEDLVTKNRAKGLAGDDLYNAIIESATRSRASVNESLGINPDHPPPLPPVRPSAPIQGAGPGTAPVISPPPNLPPVLAHPPVAVPPAEANHPPVAIPPTVLEHPPLPPWLQNPSPPGFQVTPSEPPPIFAWDVLSDPPPPPLPMPPPSGPPITIPSPPPLPPQAPVGGVIAGVGGVGAWILSQLGKLSHPFSP